MDTFDKSQIEIFSTTPQSKDFPRETYVQQVIDVASWSEQAGCTAILVYTDNSIVDPWLVSNIILQHTKKLCPLVAVQPVYMHPYAVAKMVASFAHLYGRRMYLNSVRRHTSRTDATLSMTNSVGYGRDHCSNALINSR